MKFQNTHHQLTLENYFFCVTISSFLLFFLFFFSIFLFYFSFLFFFSISSFLLYFYTICNLLLFRKILSQLIDLCDSEGGSDSDSDSDSSSSVQPPITLGWTRRRASWMYALLARLDEPLGSKEGADIRRLWRYAGRDLEKARGNDRGDGKSGFDEYGEEPWREPTVAVIELICRRVFYQAG